MNNSLAELTEILAGWSSDFPEVKIYLFGSRVRGDNRADSDVDIVVVHPNKPTSAYTEWWLAENEDEFTSLNKLLPGPLRILEYNDSLVAKILDAGRHPVFQLQNVACVWLPAKQG